MHNIRSNDYTTDLEKMRKTDRKSGFFAQIFCHRCVPGSGESLQNLFSGGGPETCQVHEPLKPLKISHNKELSILKEL